MITFQATGIVYPAVVRVGSGGMREALLVVREPEAGAGLDTAGVRQLKFA